MGIPDRGRGKKKGTLNREKGGVRGLTAISGTGEGGGIKRGRP